MGVLLSSGFCNTTPETGQLKQQTFLSPFWRLELLRSRGRQIQHLVRACFLVHRWPSSHCVLTQQRERERGGSSGPLIPSLGSPTLMTSSKVNHIPKAPTSEYSHTEIGASIHEFGGHKYPVHSTGLDMAELFSDGLWTRQCRLLRQLRSLPCTGAWHPSWSRCCICSFDLHCPH